MKALIIYASVHHGNTKKVAEYMADALPADLVDITREQAPDLSGYDIIGFASGVYFHSFHDSLKHYIQNAGFERHQKVFLVATCGVGYIDYTKSIQKLLRQKNADYIGSFQCRGYDTYGIWGKIGGIAKGHPNPKDLKNAEHFIKYIVRHR